MNTDGCRATRKTNSEGVRGFTEDERLGLGTGEKALKWGVHVTPEIFGFPSIGPFLLKGVPRALGFDGAPHLVPPGSPGVDSIFGKFVEMPLLGRLIRSRFSTGAYGLREQEAAASREARAVAAAERLSDSPRRERMAENFRDRHHTLPDDPKLILESATEFAKRQIPRIEENVSRDLSRSLMTNMTTMAAGTVLLSYPEMRYLRGVIMSSSHWDAEARMKAIMNSRTKSRARMNSDLDYAAQTGAVSRARYGLLKTLLE